MPPNDRRCGPPPGGTSGRAGSVSEADTVRVRACGRVIVGNPRLRTLYRDLLAGRCSFEDVIAVVREAEVTLHAQEIAEMEREYARRGSPGFDR
jgi:hypothetical protein